MNTKKTKKDLYATTIKFDNDISYYLQKIPFIIFKSDGETNINKTSYINNLVREDMKKRLKITSKSLTKIEEEIDNYLTTPQVIKDEKKRYKCTLYKTIIYDDAEVEDFTKKICEDYTYATNENIALRNIKYRWGLHFTGNTSETVISSQGDVEALEIKIEEE